MIAEKYAEEIESLFERYPEDQRKSAVLPLLHIAQQEYGYCSQEAMQEVADIIGCDPTHVRGIAGFYTLYYEEPVGKFVLEVCNDLACALRGADEFISMAEEKLGIKLEGTTDDGLFTLKNVMCLGACDRAPMLQCNLKFHENLDEAKFDRLLTNMREKAASNDQSPTVVDQILIETHR
ncbi:MAG: NAD(P)H-dependent oxidoreductase subunit E [Chloroflexota bacterium]